MELKERERKYWQEIDQQNAGTLRQMKQYNFANVVQMVFDMFSELELSATASFDTMRRLRSFIDQRRLQPNYIEPIASLLDDVYTSGRVRNGEVMNAYMSSYYYDYFLHLDEINQPKYETIANYHFSLAAGPDVQAKKYSHDDILSFLMDYYAVYGKEYYGELFSYALYASDRITAQAVKAQMGGRKLSVRSEEFRKLIQQDNRWLLNKTKYGTYNGFFDRATAYIASKATVEGYEAKGTKRVMFYATIDNRTTDTCRNHHRSIIPIDKIIIGVNAPPIAIPPHPCRSILLDIDDYPHLRAA